MSETLRAAAKGAFFGGIAMVAIRWVFTHLLTILLLFAGLLVVGGYVRLLYSPAAHSSDMQNSLHDLMAVNYQPDGNDMIANFSNRSRYDATEVHLICGGETSSSVLSRVAARTDISFEFNFSHPVSPDCSLQYGAVDRLNLRPVDGVAQ